MKRCKEAGAFVRPLFNEIGKVIVGQTYLVERLVIGLLANGHVLLEGVPGLAKTLSVKSLAALPSTSSSPASSSPPTCCRPTSSAPRSTIPQSGAFTTRKGPIFANLILADEINRAPAKVQSALLEAMQETTGHHRRPDLPLEEPFLVLATQNPIEQEGTYPLPEAQVDRFMLKLKIGYPTARRGTPDPGPHGPHQRHPRRQPGRRARARSSRPARSSTTSTWTTRSRTTSSTWSAPRAIPANYKHRSQGLHPAGRLARAPPSP